jgi:hypothetical protein
MGYVTVDVLQQYGDVVSEWGANDVAKRLYIYTVNGLGIEIVVMCCVQEYWEPSVKWP